MVLPPQDVAASSDARARPAPQLLGPLVARLAEARRRSRTRLIVEGAALALVIAAAALLVLRFAAMLTGTERGANGLLGAPAWEQVAAAAGLFLGLLLIFTGVAIRRTPPLAALARRADRAFDLDERVSTALELERRGEAGPVADALYADAGSRAAAIEPRRLAPFRFPRIALALPVLIVATPFVQALPIEPLEMFAPPPEADEDDPTLETLIAATADQPQVLTASERQATAEQLAELADRIEAEVAEQPDAFRQAIARSLDSLGEAAAGGEVARDDFVDALDELQQQAEQAFAGEPPESGGLTATDVAAAIAQTSTALDPGGAIDMAGLGAAETNALAEAGAPAGGVGGAPPAGGGAAATGPGQQPELGADEGGPGETTRAATAGGTPETQAAAPAAATAPIAVPEPGAAGEQAGGADPAAGLDPEGTPGPAPGGGDQQTPPTPELVEDRNTPGGEEPTGAALPGIGRAGAPMAGGDPTAPTDEAEPRAGGEPTMAAGQPGAPPEDPTQAVGIDRQGPGEGAFQNPNPGNNFREGEAPGNAAGPTLGTDEGEGGAAGNAAAELFGEFAEDVPTPLGADGIQLPQGGAGAEGRRFTVEVTPTAEFRAALEAAAAGTGWERADEAAFGHGLFTAEDRATVARYFERLDAEQPELDR